MKAFPIASLALVLALSGCSSAENEISPQEKRNNFDLCVINFMTKVGQEKGIFDPIAEKMRAEKRCRYHLR